MVSISLLWTTSFLVGLSLSSTPIGCTTPRRIESPIFNGNCPSEAARNELELIINQELKSLYGECENTSTRPTLVTKLYGGDEGSFWDDYEPCHSPLIIGIKKIDIGYDDSQVYSIQVTYLLADNTTYTAPRRGSGGSFSSSVILAEGERIVCLGIGSNDQAILQLTITTSNVTNISTVHGPFGQRGAVSENNDGYILSFRGYSSSTVLHGLAAYKLPPLLRGGHVGSCTNTFYDDRVDTLIPPVVAVRYMVIYHGTLIDSIQATYTLLDGTLYKGNHIGGSGGGPSNVTFEEGEILTGLSGSLYQSFVGKLSISTTLQGVDSIYGPYGQNMDSSFEISRYNILGFFGFAAYNSGAKNVILCNIGVYYTS